MDFVSTPCSRRAAKSLELANLSSFASVVVAPLSPHSPVFGELPQGLRPGSCAEASSLREGIQPASRKYFPRCLPVGVPVLVVVLP